MQPSYHSYKMIDDIILISLLINSSNARALKSKAAV